MKVKDLFNILDRGLANSKFLKDYKDFENYEVLINGEKILTYGVGYENDPKILSFNLGTVSYDKSLNVRKEVEE